MSILNGSTRLLPASFRGVPFAVTDQSTTVGRRIAPHEYWGSNDVWSEDVGRGLTRYRLRGFLLDNDRVYAGAPIEVQRLLLYAAAKASGAGPLTHPTLGLLMVNCESVSVSESLDGATVSWVEFSFIEAGKQAFPGLSLDMISASGTVITAIGVAVTAAVAIGMSGKSSSGAASGSLRDTSDQWTGQVEMLGNDATALSRLVASLPGNYGRYARGAVAAATPSTMAELVEHAADDRAAIGAASAKVSEVLSNLTVSTTESDYAAAVKDMISALSKACADPADSIRLLSQLLIFRPQGIGAATPSGLAVSGAFILAATLELARATTTYKPASYDDAFALLRRITDAIDAALNVASEQGQDSLYEALRTLRVAVVDDLRARGATLTHVRTFEVPAAIPALALAQRFYRDPARAEELVAAAGPKCVSPLFMPTKIQALAA
ncbi:DNA circularization N-terminal domain-containing protein [Sphingomonas sp. CBMAI 2297]|uniref:DNA circularization N-terminal domain-containing protein n=1 Tax=Sphingomonas sp. CBMAI 2297 TaxID=2991720 RepID=UPI0024566329|nr:DNA circularization N-terminal domain-containing protein [Sphingomonas sp. CBMAI 2297]MDH4745819.1 DNA circularization N-terminal domain-containing protein [Sphingomonas sp. CBMAI 2297]